MDLPDKTLKYSQKKKRIWIAGHNGMVGFSILRRLANEDCNILCIARSDLDLRNQDDVDNWITQNKPQTIIIAAATVGKILTKINYPVDFLYDNLMIATNIMHAAYIHKVENILFIGSACIYPIDAEQPISEASLLTGPPEPTNEANAIAKLAAIKLGAE